MALVLPNAQLDDLRRRYQAGEPIRKIAGELSVSDKVVHRLLRQAGATIRGRADVYAARRGFPLSALQALHARYVAGESSVDLARAIGCHSSTLRNLFHRHGLPLREKSAAHRTAFARMAPEARAAMTAPAHAAARGRAHTDAEKIARAITRQAAPPPMLHAEQQVLSALSATGVDVRREVACGPYNIDFAVGHAIAVECFGGGWHAAGRHAARHQQRTRYILDAGWHVVVVWVNKRRHSGWVDGLKHVITDLQRAGSDPSTLRQYRVVWSDGEVIACGADVDHFPLKPAREVRRDSATGRYHCPG